MIISDVVPGMHVRVMYADDENVLCGAEGVVQVVSTEDETLTVFDGTLTPPRDVIVPWRRVVSWSQRQ